MRILASMLLTVPLLAAGCEKNDPLFCQKNPGAADCPLDGSVGHNDGDLDGDPSIDARLSFGTGNYEVKLLGVPTTALLTLGGTPISTANGMPCSDAQLWVSSAQPAACFVVATNITVSSLLEVSGPRPLVLVATDTLIVSDMIDAASHVGGNVGPASPDSSCDNGTAPQTSTNGGGGGAGGSFVTAGGNGGNGNNNGTNGGVAGAVASTPPILRAGCRGQIGGTGGTGGPAGEGGGVVYLLAGTKIDLRAGKINVSGAGGSLAGNRGGGGGGGSGGMMVVTAPMILSDSGTRLVANGGGGSSGANGSAIGGDPNPANPTTAATGGSASGGCGSENGGGTGFAGASMATNGGSVTGSTCGGGGGGGGAGYIQTSVMLSAGLFSPTPTVAQ